MFKNLVITCETAQEELEVLKILEKHGNKWASGKNATEQCFFRMFSVGYYLGVCLDGEITWGDYNEYKSSDILTDIKNAKVMTAKEFIKKYTEKQCIVIYRNGSETIALDKTTGKKAVARCRPDDAYNIYVGAMLALERLAADRALEGLRNAKPEPPKLYNGKVVCVESKISSLLTVGKVYEFVDGFLIFDNGNKNASALKDFEEVCKKFCSKFIELVE